MPKVQKKLSEKKMMERREMKKLSMRRARERLKQENVDKYEEIKKKDREYKKATRKKVAQMTDREKRQMQKGWRERSRKYRQKKKESQLSVDNTVTQLDSPLNWQIVDEQSVTPSTSRIDSGRKQRRKNRTLLQNELKKMKQQCEKLNKKVSTYKQKYYREKAKNKPNDSPKKKMKCLLQGQKVSPAVRKHLHFGFVLSKQIKLNYNKENSAKKRRMLANILSGKIVQKYRYQKMIASVTSRRVLVDTKIQLIKREKLFKEKKAVIRFLEQDLNSRMCAGKKETITRSKVKKQKRLLCDSLLNLHKKFIADFPQYQKMSYPKFCKLRPFWIVQPNCKDRETCLCSVHANFKLLVKKANAVGMIDASSPKEVIALLTCSNDKRTEEICLERRCSKCLHKSLKWNEFEDDIVTYHQWLSKKSEVNIKGTLKVIKKTVKEEVQSSKYQLVSVFQDQMTKFMKHVANIQHQFKVTSDIKNKLADDEVLVHIDFSENYSCKYSEEVQSVHFGGSRNQVTLHTAVIYYKNRSNIVNRSFCTFSESPRHDALAICAHLQPVIAEIKLLVPNIRIIHFQSDGPSTQYRNKKMFYLAATFLIQKLQVKNLHWHFSEKGHGKGAPDGVGGCVKRLADGLVAQGVDIPNLQTLIRELRKTVTNIGIFEVDENKIKDIEIHLPKNIHTFKGTLKIHEITWSSEKKEVIQARRLSCQQCSANQSCKHYGIGQIPINSILQRNSDASSSNNNEFAPITSNTTSVLKKTAEAHDYVILKCYGKKTIQHYVGFIQSYSATENEYKVRFLKRTGTFQFVFSEKDTLYDVEPGDICTTLNQPTLNHRNQYTFDFNFSNYKNLF